jgi:hypothetical protein
LFSQVKPAELVLLPTTVGLMRLLNARLPLELVLRTYQVYLPTQSALKFWPSV